MVLYKKLIAKRRRSATLIQKIIRGYLARCLSNRREAYRRQHINGLKSVLLIKKLGTGHGMGNSYRIGDADKYGYCSKCDCNKFGVADSTKPLICYCGHFITNHVVGIFRDSEKEDYYIAKKPKRTTMTKRFHMATGVERNFDNFYKYLRSTMDTKTLKQSLNASRAPIQLNLEIRKPSLTDLQKYIRKKMTSPRFLVGQDVLDGKTETPSKRSQRMIQQHIKRIRARRNLNTTRRGGEDLFAPRKLKKNMLFKPQLLCKKDQVVKLDKQEVKDVEFVEMQAKASLARTRKKISNIERLDQEITLTEKNIKRIKKESDALKKRDIWAKKMAKEKNRRFKMEKEKHFLSLTLNYMNEKPLQSVDEQLVRNFKEGIKEDVNDYLENPPKNLQDLKRRNYLKQHKKNSRAENKTPKALEKTKVSQIMSGSDKEYYDDNNKQDDVKCKQEEIIDNEEDNDDIPVTNIGESKQFIGLLKKKKTNNKKTKISHNTSKKKKGRVSPTFEDPIPIDKDDIQEERAVPKYETVMNMLKNAVQNIESAAANFDQQIGQQQQPSRKIYPLHTVKASPFVESPLQHNNNMHFSNVTDTANKLIPTPVKKKLKRENVVHSKSSNVGNKQICATLQLIEDPSPNFDDIKNSINLNLANLKKISNQQEEGSLRDIPKELHIYEGRTVVGRERSCDLVLDSKIQSRMVSKVHAMLYSTFDKEGVPQIHLVDCNSTNGTYIDGKRCSIARVSLHDGSTIMFGKKSRKKDRRSELVYMVKFHKLYIPPPTPKRIRPKSTELQFMNTGGDYKNNLIEQPASLQLRRKSSFLYDRLPSTPEVGSEMHYHDNFGMPNFMEGNTGGIEEDNRYSSTRHEDDGQINIMQGDGFNDINSRKKITKRPKYDEQPTHMKSSGIYDGKNSDMKTRYSSKRHEDDGQINIMQSDGFNDINSRKKITKRPKYDEQPTYMKSSGIYDGNNSNMKGTGNNKFPSLLVLRAPSRGNLMNATDTLLSKAWPSADQLNWVIRGSSRHKRIRRRLVQSNPVGGNNSPSLSRRLMDESNEFGGGNINKLETL